MQKLASILLLLISCNAIGQQYYLKGQIKDDKNKELAGVRMRIKSTGQVFQSGQGGYFGIVLAKQTDTIQFSIFGYKEKSLPVDTRQFCTVTLGVDEEELLKSRKKLLSRTERYKVSYDDLYHKDNETYSSIFENRFLSTGRYPATQIALHYNRASYSNMRRFLSTGTSIPPDAVRLDEMLNYFDWNYTEPEGENIFKMDSRLTACPWNKQNQLLFININSKKLNLEKLPPSHLVFLIDVSGSMVLPNRLPLLKSGFRFLVNNLRSKDTVSLVAYGGKASVLLEAISGSEKATITNVIDSLQAGGVTPGEFGIRAAYRLARLHYIKGGNNRVILATDGDFNVGIRNEQELEQLIEREKRAGIYLTCLGVGMGDYKDSKIQVLAQKGNGNFAYLDSYAEAEKVLFKEFFQTLYTVADNASISIRFDTTYVEQYRLIGYDNKIAAIRDTSAMVQGGEVGSGTSLMMAFEIVPKKESTRSDENIFAEAAINYISKISLRPEEYKYRVPNVFSGFNQLEEDYRFASAVIMLGMKLKKSVHAKKIKWDLILNTVNNAFIKQSFTRKEFLELVDMAKKGVKKKKKFLIFNVKEE